MAAGEEFRRLVADALARSGLGVLAFEQRHGLKPSSIKAIVSPALNQTPSIDKAERIATALGLEFYIGPPRDSAAPLPPDLLESIARAAAGSPLSLDRLVRAVIFAEVGLASRGATFSPAKKGQLVAAIYQLLTMDPHNEAMIQRLVDLAAAA